MPVEPIAHDIMTEADVTLVDTTYLITEISGAPRQDMIIVSDIVMFVAAAKPRLSFGNVFCGGHTTY